MKNYILYIVFILLFPLSVLSQQATTESQQQEKPAAEKPLKKGEASKERVKEKAGNPGQATNDKYIDNDGDGIDDKSEGPANETKEQKQHRMMMEQNRQRLRDKFIDKDGDGINDDRCGGMGIGHKKKTPGRGGK